MQTTVDIRELQERIERESSFVDAASRIQAAQNDVEQSVIQTTEKVIDNLGTGKMYLVNSLNGKTVELRDLNGKPIEGELIPVAYKDKDEDGNVYEEIGDYGNLWPTNFSTNTNIRHLVRGDMLDYSEVLDPVDADGIISVEYCGNNRFYKILNLDTRPNLYGIQSLVY